MPPPLKGTYIHTHTRTSTLTPCACGDWVQSVHTPNTHMYAAPLTITLSLLAHHVARAAEALPVVRCVGVLAARHHPAPVLVRVFNSVATSTPPSGSGSPCAPLGSGCATRVMACSPPSPGGKVDKETKKTAGKEKVQNQGVSYTIHVGRGGLRDQWLPTWREKKKKKGYKMSNNRYIDQLCR